MTEPERHHAAAELSPEALSLIDTYFARVHGAMLVSAAGDAAESVDELRSHVLEELAGSDGSAAAVSSVLAELGPPETLARSYSDEPPATEPVDVEASSALSGRFLGMPYELRMPTTARVASRWWDPRNPHVFVPRVFGMGWDINFGALAVRTGLVRPDDEDEPFEAAPPRAVAATLAVPVALACAFVVLVAVRYASLPAQLPTNWDFAGNASGLAPKAVDVAGLALLCVLPVIAAASAHLRRRPALNRVAASAFATLLSAVSLAVMVQTVAAADGSRATWPLLVGLVLALVLPFAMLTALSRMGRSGEQRRDLPSDRSKERV